MSKCINKHAALLLNQSLSSDGTINLRDHILKCNEKKEEHYKELENPINDNKTTLVRSILTTKLMNNKPTFQS